MSENYRLVTKSAHARNRRVRAQARRVMENKLTKQYGNTPAARRRAQAFMRGKDVHKTKTGTRLVAHAAHGKKHGRGHRGKPGVYRNK
ncbi:hypothetical protein LCGC14_0791030 [marine sediment metagenome]|uniref:Uncharacterized protein n=1 Tax=marine sediment metagenome TaxID=412755 RepID=A0A0F9SCI9_9ZZZZ